MASPSELVNGTFALAQTYAGEAKVQLADFTESLRAAIYTPPTISVTWNSLPAPSMPSLPVKPTMPTISYTGPTTTPAPLDEEIPAFEIDDFDEPAPVLNLPDAPSISFGAVPTVPDISPITVPDAPVVDMPDAPTLLALSTVSFGGVDLKEDWLDKLEDMPTLSILSPTPYTYALGPAYASELLETLKATLKQRMNGGTGLPPAVEAAIFGRARDREAAIALGNQASVLRASEAAGFQLPSGVLADQLRQAGRDYYAKLSEASREIAIKQAELEQQNLRETIAAGMQLEGQLIDYSYKLEQLTFESAKVYADNAIQMHNAALQHFKTLLEGYQAYASVYKTIIDSQLAKVEVFKAQLAAEQAKANINQALVAQYKAQIEAGMSQVEIYRAQVGAAQTLVELERAKIGAAGEQIRAFVATVNAETSKVEVYKGVMQGEAMKTDIYKTQAQVFGARVGAQAERSRALVSRYQALVGAKSAEWEGYRAIVAAEGARIDALGKQSSAQLEAFRAETHAIQSQAELQTRVWETSMKQYEAGIRVSQEAAKMNNDAAIQTNNARLEAAKAGTQVYAQLTSSAYGMMHTTAGVTGSSSMTVGYSYGGDVSGTVPPITTPGG